MQHSSQHQCLLKQAEELELVAKKFGFYWQHIHQLIEQIQSECAEIEEACQKNDRLHLQEEIGDLLHAGVSLAVFCQLDPQETFRKAIEKFQKRYDLVVKLAKRDGHDHLHNQSFETLMNYWNQAKQELNKKT